VPVTWQVGGAVELGTGATVSPTVANPVFVQEYPVWFAGNPPIVVTETVGYAAIAASGEFVSYGAIGLASPALIASTASVVIEYEVLPPPSVSSAPLAAFVAAGTAAFPVSVAITPKVAVVPAAAVMFGELHVSTVAANVHVIPAGSVPVVVSVVPCPVPPATAYVKVVCGATA
jgi:hypothetical protein